MRIAQKGDKKSMEAVLDHFTDDIDYLSRFIMLPKEEAVQVLRIELISIVCEQL
ncbi:MAG: helix-turn-helix domain-containing protein [Bacillota bacterium]